MCGWEGLFLGLMSACIFRIIVLKVRKAKKIKKVKYQVMSNIFIGYNKKKWSIKKCTKY